ncbi:6-carboxytetrahydropterin synthase [Oscillochloris sp. ZM17-4]|uniref:6-pyruvoyl trahydropterin synthase family protein n=1 Tax=Oscillochloris sp. ZM17-4 TaxID=2866714 RepID=UPI001C734E58|nr:6-carboxytetrahydropterin synthase [Oscillochloris sp. ZM17-4]MBX0327224.1 6-carboxytetrahydropterin synthase [Oscillochloris sp. ZM17-4]
MYEIGVSAQFEAAHRLVGDFGPATRMHGHSYRIEAAVDGPELKPDGTLIDISILQGAVAALVAELHYRDLGEVPGLAGINTTAENLAGYCWRQLADALRGRGLRSLTVRIWENPGAYAAFAAEL